jgi:hypothetical protein
MALAAVGLLARLADWLNVPLHLRYFPGSPLMSGYLLLSPRS